MKTKLVPARMHRIYQQSGWSDQSFPLCFLKASLILMQWDRMEMENVNAFTSLGWIINPILKFFKTYYHQRRSWSYNADSTCLSHQVSNGNSGFQDLWILKTWSCCYSLRLKEQDKKFSLSAVYADSNIFPDFHELCRENNIFKVENKRIMWEIRESRKMK